MNPQLKRYTHIFDDQYWDEYGENGIIFVHIATSVPKIEELKIQQLYGVDPENLHYLNQLSALKFLS